MNKRGQFGILLAFLILCVTFIAMVFAGPIIVGVGAELFDQINTPIQTIVLPDSGEPEINATQGLRNTIGTANTTIQTINGLVGVFLIFMIIGIFAFAGFTRFNPSPLLIGTYILLAFFLIIMSLFVSNRYEALHDSDNLVGDQLKTLTLASYIAIYLPIILTVVIFIGGLIIFVGSDRGGGI